MFCDVAPHHRGGGKSKCAIQLLPWLVVALVLLLPVVNDVTATSTRSQSRSESPSVSPSESHSDSPSVSPSDSPSDSPTPSLSLTTPTDSTHSRTATHRSRSLSLSPSFTSTDTSSFTSTDTPSFTRNATSATTSVSSMRSNTESGSLTGASNSGTTSDDITASHASISLSPTAERSRHSRTESSTPTESMTPERTVATPSDSASASLSNSTTPTWSQSPTSSASVSPSLSHSRTLTHSLSNTSSQGTATISRTPDASLTMSLSQTASTSSSNSFGSRTLSRSMESRTLSSTRGSISKTASMSPSAVASGSPTTTTSRTSSQSLSFTAAVSGGTISGTPSLSQGASVTIDTQSPSQSTSSTATSTITPPPTPTKTESASASQAFSSSVSSSRGTPSVTASPQKSQSDSPTFSRSPSVSASATQTESLSTTTSASPDRTASPTNTVGTPSTSNTSSPSMTLSLTLSRATLSAMVTGSQTDTESPSLTMSMSSSSSVSPTAVTPTPDASLTSTPSPSNSISLSPSRASATWQGTSSASTSNELSLSAASVSPTLTATPSPTLTLTPTSSDSNEPTTTSTATSSATASAEETLTASLTSTQTLTDTTTTTNTMTMTDEASLSFSGTVTRSMSDEATDTAVSGSPSPTLSASSSVSTSEEVTASPTTTMSEDVTPSASSSLSGSPSVTPSPEPSRSHSLSMSSSPSDTETEPDSVTKSPSTSRSLTPEPSVTFSTTDTLTRTSTRSNPSMTLTLTKNLCDDVYFDNISDVFTSVDVVARAGQSLSSLVASPDGNESTVYYQLSRVEFGQLKSGLAVTLHTATPIRNMYGQTSPIWTPMPVVTNCALSNFTIVDMYTFSFALSYISNEQIGVSTSYACTLVFRNDAFACPELLGSVGNRSLLNVTAAIRIVGGEAATSFWDSLAQTLGTIAGILSGGAALLHQSRASSINSFADCLYSLVDPPSIGDHPLGFGFGPEVGYYLRGAVVGNACFFFIVVVAHSLVVMGLTIRSYFVEYYDPMHPPTESVDTTTSRNLREVMDEADAGVDVKKKEKLKRVQLSRAQFPLRHELQYQASIARFPSASVAGAVLTYDGTCTASIGLILHNVTDYDQALGVLGLVFVSSFIVVQFMITKTYFRCGSKKLSRKYKDIDTPTESSEDDEQTTTSGGRNNKSLTIGPRRSAATRQAQHHSSSLIELMSVGDENPDAPPVHLSKDTTTLQKRNVKKANESEVGEDLHEAPPSASKRLSFWLFSARMKWLRLDRYPYFKGMFMSLFEDYTIAYFGCAELIVSLIIGTASGVMISERSICNALAGLSLTCLFIFILGMLYANPFINRLDLFHSLAANSFAFLGAILLFIYSRQLQPDQSLANAAANLATMVSVLNVIKFLTDIFAKGKQFRQFIGIEGRERMRESKKKHLKVLKKSMLLAAQGKQTSGHGNIFSGASSNGSDDIFSDAASDSSHHVGSLEPHDGTSRRVRARHAGRTGKMRNVEATSSDGSITERVNWDLNSSWSGRGATDSPGASAAEGARQSSFGDDPLGRSHRSRRATQRRKGEDHNHHLGASLSTRSRSPTPQPMLTSARAWALEELGLDTTHHVDLSVPLQDDAAFDAQWDNAAFLGRFASGDIRYAPPPPALTSLDDLQDRIDSQKYIDGPPQAPLYLPKAMQSKLTQHVLASKSHGNQHHHRGSGAGSRATVGGGDLIFGNSPALRPAAGAQQLVAGRGLTGHDIERAIAVEQDVRRDAQWFGGILSTSTQRGTHEDVHRESKHARDHAEEHEVPTIGRRRLSTFFPTAPLPKHVDYAAKDLDDVFDVL